MLFRSTNNKISVTTTTGYIAVGIFAAAKATTDSTANVRLKRPGGSMRRSRARIASKAARSMLSACRAASASSAASQPDGSSRSASRAAIRRSVGSVNSSEIWRSA